MLFFGVKERREGNKDWLCQVNFSNTKGFGIYIRYKVGGREREVGTTPPQEEREILVSTRGTVVGISLFRHHANCSMTK